MSQQGFHEIGTGLVVFEHPEPVEGPAVWLDSPDAVLDFVSREDPTQWIVIARGGTTTFLTPALSAGVKGVMTLQGAPESHLGILSREYGIPCLMSVAFNEGVRSERGELIPPDGAIVRIDVSARPEGRVELEDGAVTETAGAADAAPDPEVEAQAAQLQALLASYRGEISGGARGDRQMRARLRSGILDTDAQNIARALEPREVSDFLAYSGWNLWDLIAARQTEGESGLIPRQEYETVAFVQQWGTYGPLLRRIEEAIGVDGIVELGRTTKREIGTKLNHVHAWTGICPLVGRGIVTQMGLEDPGARPEDVQTIIQFMRRLQHGLWGGGPGFVSGRGYVSPVLEDHWIQRFRDEERRLDDEDELAAFRRFNATTELAGFLLHYDCRAGLCDTGPYPLPDGGFVLVRDHFLHEPVYEWSGVLEGLPYCVTEAMFFRPDGPQEILVNDIATTFARPANYLKHLSGAVVYARDRWDTPMSELRVLGDAEMATIVERCNAAMLDLYAGIGAKSRDERIADGVKVYTRDMMFPYARPAGLWDTFMVEGFDDLCDVAQRAYGPLTDGGAAEVLGAVFLMGHGLVPEEGLGTPPEVTDPEALATLHWLALRGNATELPSDPAPLVQAALIDETPAGYLLTSDGHRVHADLLERERASVDLERLSAAYERFLAANGSLKTLSARAASAPEDERPLLLVELGESVERVEPVLRRSGQVIPRFEAYVPRLQDALARAESGDWNYVASPRVDSVHTVWMQVHEDYLLTLGRSREAEGSY